jgi:serine/threonine-protein kinase
MALPVNPDGPSRPPSGAAPTVAETTGGSWSEGAAAAAGADAGPGPAHLTLLERIGAGGMGEVWSARDARLDCVVALKAILPTIAQHPAVRERFFREARLTARLQHPGIVPVHEIGALADGRLYYTMKRVEGAPFSEVLREVERVRLMGRPSPWTLRARLQVLVRVAEAVGYAHARGVVHRDLKPDNIRVGELGEVIVLDWGIAREIGAEPEEGLLGTVGGAGLTRGVIGTPGFMAPEQARGEADGLGPQADVFALGRILRLTIGEDRDQVDALHELIDASTAPEPGDRPADGRAFALELSRWLDGARRREIGLRLVEQADEMAASVARLRAEAQERRARAAELQRAVGATEAEERKADLWAEEDEAQAQEQEARLLDAQRLQVLNAIFTHAPGLPEAHLRLADHFRLEHERAEARGDAAAAAEAELHLRAHDQGAHAAYLRGEGTLSLVTDPPGAQVRLYRYELRLRRLQPVFQRELGPTPLSEVSLPKGSYLLHIEAEGHATVLHPVSIRRLQHEEGRAPGEASPRPLRLPRSGELGPEDRLVTPGWTALGGDPEAANTAPSGRGWVEGCVMKRLPVTNREYLTFLHALVEEGRVDEALRHAPRERLGADGGLGALHYGWDGRRFSLVPDAEGDVWLLDWPVFLIDQPAARAYADWLSRRDGLDWQLPREDVWERAARGADGRCFPWGDFLDPTWACYRHSHAEGARANPWVVGACPVDESPFGVGDLAGGIREWTENVWGGDTAAFRAYPVLRGGCWSAHPQLVRLATRGWVSPLERAQSVGFRLCRPL